MNSPFIVIVYPYLPAVRDAPHMTSWRQTRRCRSRRERHLDGL